MSTLQIASAVISVFTTASAIIGMQCKSMRGVIIGELVANVLLGLQYVFEGAFSAAITIPFAIALSLISLFLNVKGKKVPVMVATLFVAIFAVIAFWNFTGIENLVSYLALCCFVLSITAKKSAFARIATASNCFFWLLYDIFEAPTAILTHGVLFLFTVVGIIRLDRKEWSYALSCLFKKRNK